MNAANPGIGLDIVRVDRMVKHVDDHAFLDRVLTSSELRLMPDGSRRAQWLAGRWAAKEAVAKALGCGFGAKLTFLEVEILRNEAGSPVVNLHDDAAARHGRPYIAVSITHDGDYVAAVAFVKSLL